MISDEERAEYGRKYPITLVEYDPAWPARFEAEAALLREALGDELTGRIEHFGSTAVPGLAAKPIIDILAEISSFEVGQQIVRPRLEAIGYAYIWRDDQTPPHIHFAKGYGEDGYVPGVQRVHTHMAPLDHPIWTRLRFVEQVDPGALGQQCGDAKSLVFAA